MRADPPGLNRRALLAAPLVQGPDLDTVRKWRRIIDEATSTPETAATYQPAQPEGQAELALG